MTQFNPFTVSLCIMYDTQGYHQLNVVGWSDCPAFLCLFPLDIFMPPLCLCFLLLGFGFVFSFVFLFSLFLDFSLPSFFSVKIWT